MNTALGRTETAILTNKSGGALAQGDVVIVDTANAAAITTTTTGAYVAGRIGVVIEPNGIASDALGLVAFSGYVSVINLSGTGSIGDLVKTHTVAKQGVRHAAPQVAGDFAQVLGTSATPAALLFGNVQLGTGGAAAMTNSNISPTTANVSAAVNTRYFADVSGLTADRNFILPAGAVGDEIEVNITVGDTAFELVIIGDTGISINGGSTATEWSRLFISGEAVRLIATSTTNWQVVHDGRLPCIGQLHLSAADTTNTAATDTPPTWDTKTIDRGEMGDTTNFQFNIRRAGKYRVSGSYMPNSSLTDQNYIWLRIYQNATEVSGVLITASGTSSPTIALSPKTVVCAIGDFLIYKYQPQAANRGISALLDRSWFQVEEEF